MFDYFGNGLETSKNTLRTFIITLCIFTVLLFLNFYILFHSTKKNIIESGQHAVAEVADEINNFLIKSVDAVKFTAYKTDNMILEGESNEKIQKYFVEQTGVCRIEFDNDSTGVYGVVNGEYLDGDNWVPGADYVPEERQWYIDAAAAKGEIALVSPYLDEQTGTMVMSISRMLNDNKSVVSIDVGLDDLQNLMVEQVENGSGDYALVLDSEGVVVAHSSPSKRGLSYLNGTGTLGNMVAEKVIVSGEKNFEVQYNGMKYVVFASTIGSDWYAVSVLNENALYGPLKIIYFLFFFVLLIFLGVITVFFTKLNRRRDETEHLNIQLKSISGIYKTAHLLDLNTDTFEEIISNEQIRSLLKNGHEHAMDTLKLIMDMRTADLSKRNVAQFLDFSTLDKRLENVKTIAIEFLNVDNQWCRGRFITVDKNDDGTIHRVLWMVEVIDEEKRQRDNLQMLSETDRMTGILNRGGGEAKIREMLDSGRTGMFCLMDADKFKSINDNYGHGVGDKVLIEIANCLKKSFRDNDIVLRLGGDEFAAYAPTVLNETVGQQIIDRFFDNINLIKIPELKDRKICISMGVAFYKPGDDYSFDELYKRADHGTYISKKHEGNYVTFEGAGS